MLRPESQKAYDNAIAFVIKSIRNWTIPYYLVIYPRKKMALPEIVDKIVLDFIHLTNNKVTISKVKVSDIPDFAGKRKFIISEISLSNLNK